MVYDKNVDFTESRTSELLDETTYASPVGFRLLIDSLKYPNVQFNVQTASIPEITVNAATYATPQRNIEIYGDKIEYASFDISFLINEDLTNYLEIHDWLFGLVTEPETRAIRKSRDMTLFMLGSHNNVVREVEFIDAYPTSLSTVEFDAKNTNIEYLTANTSFNYSYFKVK